MELQSIPVLAIDGPSGVGKGTASRSIAEKLGWRILDSGAIYRSLALAAHRHNVAFNDIPALVALAHAMDLRFEAVPDIAEIQVLLGGENISEQVRSEQTGQLASQVAALGSVRDALRERQRAFRQSPGLVADGRDMGTVVFPDATCKIFLTADAEERAQRRYKQLKQKGISVKLPPLLNELKERDARDSARTAAPLKPADDAVIIDTTHLDIKAVTHLILTHLSKRTPNIHLE
ncbi:MAG: (d)CMP kinase [Pseudomonadota bacterium]